MNYNELTDDKVLSIILAQAKSFEEMAEVLRGNGLDITSAEIEKLSKETYSGKTGELLESDLEDVAGGRWLSNLYKKLAEWIRIRYANDGGGGSW